MKEKGIILSSAIEQKDEEKNNSKKKFGTFREWAEKTWTGQFYIEE